MNDELRIETGIPIPPPKRGHGAASDVTETLRKLNVGDSVLLPTQQKVAMKSARYALGNGNYTSRQEGSGTRIWRTK